MCWEEAFFTTTRSTSKLLRASNFEVVGKGEGERKTVRKNWGTNLQIVPQE